MISTTGCHFSDSEGVLGNPDAVRIRLHGRPLSMNNIIRMNRSQQINYKNSIKRVATDLWSTARALAGLNPGEMMKLPVKFEAMPYVPSEPMQDSDAIAFVAKAVLDAAVMIGLIPDDSPEYVTNQDYKAPTLMPGAWAGAWFSLETVYEDEVD